MTEDKFSGVHLDRCLRNKYEAVLKALSDATEVPGLARRRTAHLYICSS